MAREFEGGFPPNSANFLHQLEHKSAMERLELPEEYDPLTHTLVGSGRDIHAVPDHEIPFINHE